MHSPFPIFGYATGHAAGNTGCADGPSVVSRYIDNIDCFYPINKPDKYQITADICLRLAEKTKDCTAKKQFFAVIGGDHSSAIGTWSGVTAESANIGLIWIDAHLDSHTPENSSSGNIHGMPVASLLGYGPSSLIHLLHKNPKIQPEHLCFIGVRSYEPSERSFLKSLGVKIFYMQDIQQQGLAAIFDQAKAQVLGKCSQYGISLDLDAIDPKDAPGVGSPEKDGIVGAELLEVLGQHIAKDRENRSLVALEIAEFNPHEDVGGKTLGIILRLFELMKIVN